MSDLISLMRVGTSRSIDEIQRFNESIELIDEAFFGRNKVKTIQDVMDAIVKEIQEIRMLKFTALLWLKI